MAYIGRPLNAGNLAVQSGTGDGSDTTPIATLNYATTTNGIAVYLDGVRQLAGTDYNVTNQTTLTFTTAPANGVGIDVYFLGLEVSIPTPADGTISTAKIANNAVDETKLKDALIGDFTDVTVTASDTFLYGDATDSGNTKRDTVQGILDLAGGGAWNYISSATASTSSSIEFTSGIDSTYDVYKIIYSDLEFSADNRIEFTAGAGSYLTGGSDYSYAFNGVIGGGASDAFSTGTTAIKLTVTAYQDGATTTSAHIEVTLNTPSDTTHWKSIGFQYVGQETTPYAHHLVGCGVVHNTAAITRIKIAPHTGTITSGTARMYGISKS